MWSSLHPSSTSPALSDAPWRSVAGALGKAGFAVKALAVVQAENAGDHCKRNVNAMLHDLVLECVPAQALQAAPTPNNRVTTRISIRPLGGSSRESRPAAPDVRLEFTPKTPDEMNLAAVGLALAECVRNRDTAPLRELYRRHLACWTAGPELIG